MSWMAVARKDFRDAVRSRLLWALSIIFLLLAVGIAAAYAWFDSFAGSDASAQGLIFFVSSVVGTFVALAALLACYKSITGERESGTIKILLALPHTRRDVVIGKVVGRTGVLAIPVVGTLLIGALVGGAMLGEIAIVPTILLAIVALIFTFAYVSLYVGLSASTGSDTRAALLAVGFFFLFEMFWLMISSALVFVASGFAIPNEPPAWFWLVNQLPPSQAFLTSLSAVLPDVTSTVSGGGMGGGMGLQSGNIDAFFATPWVGFLILLFWATVPVVLGYLAFTRADV